MRVSGHQGDSARIAKARLIEDGLLRPHDEKRAALQILSRRLDRAVRDTLLHFLAGRVSTDARFDPILQKLVWIGRATGL